MNEIRNLLCELGLENSTVFENPSYDSAIVGYDENSGRVIYDYDKMVSHLMNEDSMTQEDAIEFIDYNTVRACQYLGDNSPIILRNIENY